MTAQGKLDYGDMLQWFWHHAMIIALRQNRGKHWIEG